MLKFQRVLAPTDLSECSEAALQMAKSLAADHGAELVVLHVVGKNEGEKADERDLREWAGHGYAGRPIRAIVAHGEPASEILKAINELNCDLVVLGTHGRTGRPLSLAGSVATEVARVAPCPIVLVKRPLLPA